MDKIFKFKLESLLQIRDFKKQQKEAELGKVLQELEAVKREIEGMRDNIGQLYELQEKAVLTGTNNSILVQSNEFIKSCREEIVAKEKYLEALEKRSTDKMQEMNIAIGEFKAVKKMKEDKKKEHDKKVMKKMYEELEDIINMREKI